MKETISDRLGGAGTTFEAETKRRQGFTLSTLNQGEWYLRKLAEMKAAEKRIKAQAQAMREADYQGYQERERALLRVLQGERERFIARHGREFEEIVRAELAREGRVAGSVIFFHGTATLGEDARLTIEDQ